jgi:hypothetical protein
MSRSLSTIPLRLLRKGRSLRSSHCHKLTRLRPRCGDKLRKRNNNKRTVKPLTLVFSLCIHLQIASISQSNWDHHICRTFGASAFPAFPQTDHSLADYVRVRSAVTRDVMRCCTVRTAQHHNHPLPSKYANSEPRRELVVAKDLLRPKPS